MNLSEEEHNSNVTELVDNAKLSKAQKGRNN